MLLSLLLSRAKQSIAELVTWHPGTQLLQGSFTGRDSGAARQAGFARRQELVQGSDNLGDGKPDPALPL